MATNIKIIGVTDLSLQNKGIKICLFCKNDIFG